MIWSRCKTLLRATLPTLGTVVVLVLAWQIACQTTGISENLIPSPSTIVEASWQSLPTLLPATFVTTQETLIGFVIAIIVGILLGVLFHVVSLIRAALFPLVYAAQTMPLIAIAPIFLIWFGFEISGKIVIVAIFSVFPIVVQTIRGLDAVPSFYTDVALTCGAGRTWTLWHVKLRVAARQIFGGIRIAAAYVFGTAATAEYLGSRNGLGIWLQAAYNSFRTPLIFTASITIIILTTFLMLTIGVCERMLLGPVSDDEDPDNQL